MCKGVQSWLQSFLLFKTKSTFYLFKKHRTSTSLKDQKKLYKWVWGSALDYSGNLKFLK